MEAVSIDGNMFLSIASGILLVVHILIHTADYINTALLTASLGVSLLHWSSDEGIFVYNSSLSSASAIRVENVPTTGIYNISASVEQRTMIYTMFSFKTFC